MSLAFHDSIIPPRAWLKCKEQVPKPTSHIPPYLILPVYLNRHPYRDKGSHVCQTSFKKSNALQTQRSTSLTRVWASWSWTAHAMDMPCIGGTTLTPVSQCAGMSPRHTTHHPSILLTRSILRGHSSRLYSLPAPLPRSHSS